MQSNQSPQDTNPANPLPKPTDEQFCQLVAKGTEPHAAYRQVIYRGTDFSGTQKFKIKACRKMKQDNVRARIDYLKAQVQRQLGGFGIERGELIQSLTQKYWEAFNAKCLTMRDRADQARVLEVLANRISLLTGIDKVTAPPPKLTFVRKEQRDRAAVAPPPRKEGGTLLNSEGGVGEKHAPGNIE